MANNKGILEDKLQTYYKDINLNGYRQIFCEVVKEYQGDKFERVLDIGAGNGSFYDANHNFDFKFYALEASKQGIENMRSKGISVTPFMLKSNNSLPFEDGYFSCVIFNQVVEHVEKEVGQYYIKEIVRVLESGGVGIIKSPSAHSRVWRTDPHHVYCWKPNELYSEIIKYDNLYNFKLQRLPLEPWMLLHYNENIIDYWHKNNKQPMLRKIFSLCGRTTDFFLNKLFNSDVMVSVSNISFVKK